MKKFLIPKHDGSLNNYYHFLIGYLTNFKKLNSQNKLQDSAQITLQCTLLTLE